MQICLAVLEWLNFAMSLTYCQPVNACQTSLLILGFAREFFSLVCGFHFLMRCLGVKGKGGNGTHAAVKYKFRTGLQTVSLHLMSYFAVAFWHLKLRKVGKGSAILL